MMNKLFLDTNILLDCAMSERPAWTSATMLVDECAYGQATGYISSLSLKDVSYILSKYASATSAREFILAALDLFEVVGVDAAISRVAALSNEADYEDGIIRACAEHAAVDFIISHDENAFKKSSIRRLSAQDYLDLFCHTEELEESSWT